MEYLAFFHGVLTLLRPVRTHLVHVCLEQSSLPLDAQVHIFSIGLPAGGNIGGRVTRENKRRSRENNIKVIFRSNFILHGRPQVT